VFVLAPVAAYELGFLMSFRFDWTRLLSDQRPPISPEGGGGAGIRPELAKPLAEGLRSRFEQDYDRIIFSAPFRRLAGKTQVHPFASVDHVHNRLTHTLEVASVGRSLAAKVAQFLSARGELPPNRTAADLAYIVQAACLAHDMGNPPFGHAGEYAIRGWAGEHLEAVFPSPREPALDAVLNDWRWFEGNAQSFRLVVRSDQNERDYFRFTYASLGAMIKYPWVADDARVPLKGKHNAFSSEKVAFYQMAEGLGLRRADGTVARHPLSFLSEVADDICYRISDFEDAVEMRILSESHVRAIFAQIVGRDPGGRLSALRAAAIGTLIDAAAGAFFEHYEAIMTGVRAEDLRAAFPANIREAMATIKQGYDEAIFGHRTKVATELGAHNILGQILAVHSRAVRDLAGGYEKLSFVHKRCLELAWEKDYVVANQGRGTAWWLGRVMDHVAGMTDAYATQVAREISGG
jgi:dGTPase